MSSQFTESHTTDKKPPLRFLRLSEVAARVGLNKRTLQRMVKDESFPKPVRLHERSIGFVEAEVEEWMESRMADRQPCSGGADE